ncbi:hypothetical protein RFI_21779 [Reticulomyxa filosa]|uniref:Uncharacterized protein n=1 Tax=Reticulomyxa filosa TaxID=46433 RepID=X6MQ75_RETFI|nr:hypothetical protein RFI_21779 [Reticulomyxa filosa]|eukprot:ETO15587.1 hypothetical protein RFI_21779 [Reticulomyxa filosa]
MREAIQNSFGSLFFFDPFLQMKTIMTLMEGHLGNTGYQMECMQWVVQIFDVSVGYTANREVKTGEVIPANINILENLNAHKIPHCSFTLVSCLIRLLKENKSDPRLVALISKVFGIWAIQDRKHFGEKKIKNKKLEQNRKHIGQTEAIKVISDCLTHHFEQVQERSKKDIYETSYADMVCLCSILWSLVVVGRPLGGIEGETYQMNTMRNCNVLLLSMLNIHRVVCSIIKHYVILKKISAHHTSTPNFSFGYNFNNWSNDNEQKSDYANSILSKCYWLIVNLSLIDDVKKHLIGSGLIEHIVQSLQLYSSTTYKELQYRACFALINLCVRSPAKQQILRHCGIPLIIEAMNRFPTCCYFQKCCANLIRSLCSTNSFHTGI